MKLEARVKSTIDLVDTFFLTGSPFDIVCSKYFKNNKWIGAADRRAIAEFSYEMFRNFEKLKFLTNGVTENFGRILILMFLKHERKYSLAQIREIFSGRQYAPEKLTDFEMNLLRKPLPIIPEYVRLNYPLWLDPYFKRAFENSLFAEELKALNAKAFTDLRVNPLRASKQEVMRILSEEFKIEEMPYAQYGVRILNGRISRSHEVIQKGYAEIQDEGSQLIAEACGVNPGNIVIDYCAGAGGKTLALSAYMENKGRLFALDKFPERLENAKRRLKRAGANNVFCQEITGKWIKRHIAIADVVLVDAPCSGTGTWRRNPDMRAKFQQSDLDELLSLQFEILSSAQRLVKPGGRLIYSTCSVLKEEDEDQVKKFEKTFPNFSVVPIKLKNYVGEFLQLSPLRNNTDGFFAAVMKKNE